MNSSGTGLAQPWTPQRTALALTAVACILWLASWALPVLENVRGWEAFRYALSPLWPFRGHDAGGEDAVPQVLSALSNVVFIILVAHVVLERVTRPGLFMRVAILCFILNLYWFVQLARSGELADLRAGYYAWLAAFALLMASGLSIRRTSRTPTAGMPA